MATGKDYAEYVMEQLSAAGPLRLRKMFGEYMLYLNEKPLVLLCDNTAYVKIVPATTALMGNAGRDHPYEGSREHYILDTDDIPTALKVLAALDEATPPPKPKKKNIPKEKNAKKWS